MDDDECLICGHSLWDHRHYPVKWELVNDQQVSVDREMKERWEAAKDGEEKLAVLIEAGNKALEELRQVIATAIKDLAKLVDDYNCLALSGCFSAQVEKTVTLLEQRFQGMDQKAVGQEQLQEVDKYLEHMKEKLRLLRNAEEQVQKETVRVVLHTSVASIDGHR